MLDVLLEKLKKLFKSRITPIVMVYIVLFCILVNQLFILQIIKGPQIEKELELKSEVPRILKSTRGNIRDSKGKLLAHNELSYTITYEDNGELITNEEKNNMVYQLIRIMDKNNETIAPEFPIAMDEDEGFVFTSDENSQLRFKKDIFYHRKVEEVTEEEKVMTAKEVFEYLKNGDKKNPMFEISDQYTVEETLKIMTIRYAMFMNSYTKYLPISIATNVKESTVVTVKENNAALPGVDILQETYRVYDQGKYFAHLLGYTGLISTETLSEFDSAKNPGNYSATDQIGKDGVEKQFEEYLHGMNGSETVTIGNNKRVIEVKDTIEPTAGNDIYLTIDSDLQKVVYDILEQGIAGILVSKITNSTDVGSKGVSASRIKIPIYDVYFALINNNVLDSTTFDMEDATNLEKNVHQKFLSEQKSVISSLEAMLDVNSHVLKKDVSTTSGEYLDYIYSVLKQKEVILKEVIDSNDSTFIKYTNDEISLSEFLQYALSNNWVDLNKLGIGEEYYSTAELYKKLIDHTKKILAVDSAFSKKIYRSLIYSFKLTGTEICLLLFDQGVLKYNEGEINSLKNGTISAYNFLIDKIKKLKITPAQLALEPCSGSALVIDPNNGDVLALVSYPSYDNNKLANTVDAAYFKKLDSDLSFPMMNRPLQQVTAPGSTYKMVAEAAALEENVVQSSEKIKDLVIFDKIFPSPKCTSNHGMVDAATALEVSCNYYLYDIGYRLGFTSSGKFVENVGLGKLRKYAEMFGFDAPSGIELYEREPRISDSDSVRSSIGQGTNAFTAAQLARYVSTIANNGTNYNLTILDKIKSIDGKTVKDNKATVHSKVTLSEDTWQQIHYGMYKVINGSKGTVADLYKGIDINVAGKTGTAQESKSKPDHALFVSYAPYEAPEISITMSIPNGYTSHNPAQLSRDIYKYYFKLDGHEEVVEEGVKMPESSSLSGD